MGWDSQSCKVGECRPSGVCIGSMGWWTLTRGRDAIRAAQDLCQNGVEVELASFSHSIANGGVRCQGMSNVYETWWRRLSNQVCEPTPCTFASSPGEGWGIQKETLPICAVEWLLRIRAKGAPLTGAARARVAPERRRDCMIDLLKCGESVLHKNSGGSVLVVWVAGHP